MSDSNELTRLVLMLSALTRPLRDQLRAGDPADKAIAEEIDHLVVLVAHRQRAANDPGTVDRMKRGAANLAAGMNAKNERDFRASGGGKNPPFMIDRREELSEDILELGDQLMFPPATEAVELPPNNTNELMALVLQMQQELAALKNPPTPPDNA